MPHRDDRLNIPESNREIALHLRDIRTDIVDMSEGLDNLSTRLDNLESTMAARRFRFQDLMLSSLLLPLVGGMLLFLLTKTLG